MRRRITLDKFDIIHAPSLFSDGGLALKAHKEYGIPYVVAVRNTDINTFMKYLKHTYHTGREIALKAKKILAAPTRGPVAERFSLKIFAPPKTFAWKYFF